MHFCTVYEWNAEQGKFIPLAEHTRAVWPPGEGPLFRFSEYPTSEDVVMTGKPRVVRIDEGDPEASWMGEAGQESLLMFPLCAGEETLGLVEVADTEAGFASDSTALRRCEQLLQEAAFAGQLQAARAGPVDRVATRENSAQLLQLPDDESPHPSLST